MSGISRMGSRLVLSGMLVLGIGSPAQGGHAARVLAACAPDRARFCPGEVLGAGSVACLDQHHVSLTLRCRRALAAARAAGMT